MQNRNKLTLSIIVIILASSIVAGLITIRDSDLIISDLEQFIDDPFTWNPPTIEQEGSLHLYISSEVYENETDSSSSLNDVIMNPPDYEVYHMYLHIYWIEIQQKNNEIIFDLVDDPITIDLVDINFTIDLFSAFSLPEGQYSALQFYYDREIIAETNSGNKTFNAYGSDFFSIPFYQNKNNNTPVDLEIHKNEETQLLLTFEMQIRWQQQLIYPHLFGYLDFIIPVE